jgi:hypothetical protein
MFYFLPLQKVEPWAALAELRKMAEELPDGVILSMNPWEVVFDGQEKK